MGDYANCIIQAIKSYDVQNVDIFICACNSQFVNPFKTMRRYSHHIIEKTVAQGESERKIANQKDADEILQLI